MTFHGRALRGDGARLASRAIGLRSAASVVDHIQYGSTGVKFSAASLVDRGEGVKFSKHLVDRRRVQVHAGRGGDGACIYTKHKKHKMFGPGWPCGGHGGKGGDVVVRASASHHSLAHVDGVVRADSGLRGKRGRINGDVGLDAVVQTPRGVIVRELLPLDEARTKWSRGEILLDLNEVGDEFVVALGGRGGQGNNMARPHEATPGVDGEALRIELELKTIADVGLVGMPNAGKSTLLGAISRASPKIAPYPFTTVAPYVGFAEFTDGSKLTVADVPGIVEGAHRGIGLGHDFLRHLERTSVLLYLVDAARPGQLFEDLLLLQREVSLYSEEMASKPCGVVATKCDLDPARTLPRVDELHRAIFDGRRPVTNRPLFVRALSARFGDGVPGLLREVRSLLQGKHKSQQ